MKKRLIALILAQIFLNFSHAAIPVLDLKAIAEAQRMFEQAKKQLSELEEQVKTAKSQLDSFKKEAELTKKRFEGYSDFTAIFGSASAYLKDNLTEIKKGLSDADWQKIKKENDLDFSREGEMTAIEKNIKAKFEQTKRLEKMTDVLMKKTEKLDSLQKAFKNATTPQQREEVLNTLQLENQAMQNTLASVNLEIQRQEKIEQIEKQKLDYQYSKSQFRKP
ncbi:type IV secretion system protein (plasmid) [Arsenophonus nasoniae]|uniref:type IV secretion system protein n=1 Tax=Arsenophonus nasoniae TaxID=638 RepID=UPI00246845F4|nr:type IV secretion system protein [Arsenophonus nasoniae]WGM13869.1 type IV secretion system protein [Arsenophonus nasoniae]WGM18509.1 type IV secretion system protein [Arsenophonus nasoniae]